MSESRAAIPDPEALLLRLVRTPSFSGQEQAVAELLVGAMRDAGLRASIDEAGNAVGVREVPGVPGAVVRELVLLGHMDTAPGEIPVRMEEGRLYGRGSVDAKGPLATLVCAATHARLPPASRILVIGAVEEETVTSRGARHVASRYRPDACIIGEPSGWDGVTLGYKGRVLLEYVLHRDVGHTAGQQSGVAEAAIGWWNGVSRLIAEHNATREKLFDQLIPAIRALRMDSDGLRETVRLEAGIRLPPDFDLPAFVGQTTALAGDATVTASGHEVAWQTPRTSPLVAAFSAAIRASGAVPRIKLKTGTCDLNVVGPVWQCPVVAYGPGDSLLDHTPREHVVLDDYHRAIEVLSRAVEAFFSSRPL